MKIDQPKSYYETNCMQRNDTENTIKENVHKIQWLSSGQDKLLDIGSRSGDILYDYIFPIVPKPFSQIVGTDSSNAMLSYAMNNYRHPKLTFEQLDITNRNDVQIILEKYGPFNHITSFYALNWITKQEVAFQSIYDLLAPKGEILITICQQHPLYEHYRDMSALEKWSEYRHEMMQSTSPYFGSPDPIKDLRETLLTAGFQDIHVELKDREFQFDNQVFIDSINSVAPVLIHVPEDLRTEFIASYINKVMTHSLQYQHKINKMQNDHITVIPYRMLVAYARKRDNISHNEINDVALHKQVILKKDEVRMHNAERYHETNCMQRKDAFDTLMEFGKIFSWKPSGGDSLLDIGSGSGDVTFEYILEFLPQTFSRLIGSDKSAEMIEYANKQFQHSKLRFEKLDIESRENVKLMLEQYGQFDHITSFCCLHWAPNQYEVMENIFDLLQPGGKVLITICQHHPIYEHYADMSNLPKWSKYRPDMMKSTTPYFRNQCPEKELSKRLEHAGFEDINVILKDRMYPYVDQVFLDSTVPVAPFLDKISETLKAEFLKIYIDKVLTMDLPAPHKSNIERCDGRTFIPYRMLVAYARKPTKSMYRSKLILGE